MKNNTAQEHYLPLSMTETGQKGHISFANVGKNLQQKLINMGITDGNEIKVVKNDLGHPMLLAVGDARIVIGQGMSHKIIIYPS